MKQPPAPSFWRHRFLPLSLGAAAFVWSLYQAFWNIASSNLNADEPIYVAAGWSYVHGDFSANREHPPTAKYIIGLAQVVWGRGETSGRIAVAVTVILGGVVLFLWLKREIGWAGALFAATAWTLLPHGVSSGVRIDRFALLEPFMAFFAIVAFAAAWRSFRTQSWVWLCVSAVAMALSVTSKVSTAVMIPALLLLPFLSRKVGNAVVRAAVFLAVFTVAFLVLYLPMGIRSAISFMLETQTEHDANGHLVEVAGVATLHQPWWANLLFSVEGMGIAASIVLMAGGIAAFWRRPLGLTLFITTAIALLWVFYFFVSSVALRHYYYAWVWLLCVLAGIGISVLFARNPYTRGIRPFRIVGSAIVALALVCAVWTSVAVWQERATGMALVVQQLDESNVQAGDVLVSGMADWEYLPYLDDRQTTTVDDPDIVAIAVKQSVRFPEDPELSTLLRLDAAEFDTVVIDDVTLYILKDASRASAAG